MELEGKHVVVVGAGSGTGRALAIAGAARGATVTLVGRRRPELEDVARRVGSAEDVAAAALFALSNPFVTGAVLAVDGGGVLV